MSITKTSRVPVEGKSSVCAISMKYKIMILIIIIITLGQILSSYIANTSRTHACMHARTHARPHTRAHTHTALAVPVVAVRWVGAPNHDGVNTTFRRWRWRSMTGRCFIQVNCRAATRHSR